MTTKIKILGQRNGITKAMTLAAAPVFLDLKKVPGKPGETIDMDEQYQHGRMSPKYRALQNRFHE